MDPVKTKKFHGVSKSKKSWQAKITVEGLKLSLGYFHSAVAAALAYDAYLAHLVMVGDRALQECLFNFPPKKACTIPAELQYNI